MPDTGTTSRLDHMDTTRARPAFTLIELVLAVVLGVLVLSTTLGLFVSLRHSDNMNERRMTSAMQLSLTQYAVEMSLRTMILSTTSPPRPEGAPPPPGQPRTATPPAATTPPPQDELPRVILSAQRGATPMRWVDGQGNVEMLAPQRLELTLERPPVFAEPEPGEVFVPVVRRAYASRHEREADQRRQQHQQDRESHRANRSSPRQDSVDRGALPAGSAGRGSTDTDAAGQGNAGQGGTGQDNPFDPTEPAIAPGVRGAFELTFEVDRPRPGDPVNPDGGSWTLWWQTLPPLDGAADTEGLTPEELDSDPMYRPVALASNLRWCRWQAVRAGQTLDEFTSTWWEDLPAYVTLEIQTTNGKWSKWMFEVQGTKGPEPGSVIGGAPSDQQGQDAAVDAAIQAVTEQLGGAPTGSGNTSPMRRGRPSSGAGKGGNR